MSKQKFYWCAEAYFLAYSLQVPIQVNKYLAYSDGMRIVESGKLLTQSPASDGLLFTELDRLVLRSVEIVFFTLMKENNLVILSCVLDIQALML